MTALETRKRKQERKVLLKRLELTFEKKRRERHIQRAVRSVTTPRPPMNVLASLPSRFQALRSNREQVVLIDNLTAELIKLEVTHLLKQRKSGCSIMVMANVLVGSDRIKEQHAEAFTDENEDPVQHLVRRFGKFMVTSLRGSHRMEDDREMKRKYDFVRACNKLQADAGAQGRTVTTWDETRVELSKVFCFPEDFDKPADKKEDSTAEDSVEKFRKKMEEITIREKSVGMTPSEHKWQEVARAAVSKGVELDGADVEHARRLEEALQESEARKKKAEVEEFEERLKREQQEREAREFAESLMRPLDAEETELVHNTLHSFGSDEEIIAQVDADSIQRESIRRLLPGQWLNDEVIHYFYIMLAKRDEEMCRADPNRKRSHFFKSFFMTKLRNEGNVNPDLDGKYEYRNVRRWSKKVPGKDIFNLDKIFFPINQGQMHWVCAVAFMQEKRIQFYDSMGGRGRQYLQDIFQYVQDEHMDKKKVPLPDIDEWTLVECTDDTPRQLNGTSLERLIEV
jgi:sentrin-specific protease 1